MNNNVQEFYFCYSPELFNFLRYVKGFKYICTARHRKSYKPFYLFERSKQLELALTEYSSTH